MQKFAFLLRIALWPMLANKIGPKEMGWGTETYGMYKSNGTAYFMKVAPSQIFFGLLLSISQLLSIPLIITFSLYDFIMTLQS